MTTPESLKDYLINSDGHFGPYGGRYIPELLIPIMEELEQGFQEAMKDETFIKDLMDLYHHYSGRPTPLTSCKNLSDELGGAQIYLKNEGLNHTGAHKINHCLGQILLAKRLGKTRIIAETGAGQHGLASATVAAKFGMKCTVYMGAKDYARQRPNVFWMERMGAEVIPVTTGGQILRDAINEALRDLITNPNDSHFLHGTVCGPSPYPVINTTFQKIVGEEVRQQITEQAGKLPDYLVACVGGGSNAIGLFYDFLDDPEVKMIGVEAGGEAIREVSLSSKGSVLDSEVARTRRGVGSGKFLHAARFQHPEVGVVEGFKSYFLQDKDGQIGETKSTSAGLDYSGVGPQHAYLHDIGRVKYTYALDEEVMEAYELLCRTEGIIPAMESSHALVEVIKLAPTLKKDQVIIFNLSGRGDKDLFITTQQLDKENFNTFLKSLDEKILKI